VTDRAVGSVTVERSSLSSIIRRASRDLGITKGSTSVGSLKIEIDIIPATSESER
jgi:hypothetical protein